MALYDADNYVRVGPHFKNRPLLEFGFEHGGAYQGPQSTYVFDPLGQVGQPRWLALRRNGPDYTAYLSADGFNWNQFGSKLTLPDTSGDLRSAVYAFNGRSNNPSERAVFDHFGTGLAFRNRPNGPFQPTQFPGWTAHEDCKAPVSATIAFFEWSSQQTRLAAFGISSARRHRAIGRSRFWSILRRCRGVPSGSS